MSVSTTKTVVIAALAFAGGVAASGLSSAIAATNGTLMVHVKEQETSRAALQAQGWQLKQLGPR